MTIIVNGKLRKVSLRRWYLSKNHICSRVKQAMAMSEEKCTPGRVLQTSLMHPWDALGFIHVLLQFWGDLDWFNFFPSAPGLSVFTTADPGAPKPTHVPFEVLWNCYPSGYISTSAKENSGDKFFSLWVLQERGCSKCSQRTEQLIALNGNQLIVSLCWFSQLLSLPGHSDYHTSSTPLFLGSSS